MNKRLLYRVLWAAFASAGRRQDALAARFFISYVASRTRGRSCQPLALERITFPEISKLLENNKKQNKPTKKLREIVPDLLTSGKHRHILNRKGMGVRVPGKIMET
nr:hypothetical protein [uncultured Acetatifactor sp.]